MTDNCVAKAKVVSRPAFHAAKPRRLVSSGQQAAFLNLEKQLAERTVHAACWCDFDGAGILDSDGQVDRAAVERLIRGAAGMQAHQQVGASQPGLF